MLDRNNYGSVLLYFSHSLLSLHKSRLELTPKKSRELTLQESTRAEEPKRRSRLLGTLLVSPIKLGNLQAPEWHEAGTLDVSAKRFRRGPINCKLILMQEIER
jgi:hypothetical protein